MASERLSRAFRDILMTLRDADRRCGMCGGDTGTHHFGCPLKIVGDYVEAYVRTRSEGAEPTGEPCGPDHDPGASPERYWCGCVRHARWERCPAHVCYDHDAEPPRQNEGAEPETEEVRKAFFAGMDAGTHDCGAGFYSTPDRERFYQKWITGEGSE